MAKVKPGANPFYVLLVLAGIAFTVTACGYGVMTVQGLQPRAAGPPPVAAHPLLSWLDRHGPRLMFWELALLLAATVLAMATDSYWSRRGARSSPTPPDGPEAP
jgi:hypothetical protein